jgi:hypothetical protein
MSRWLARGAVTFALVVTSLLCARTSAFADPGSGGDSGSGGSSGGVLTATVSYSTSGGSGGGDGCSWVLADQVIAIGNGLGEAEWPQTDPQTGVVYHLWTKTCPGGPTVYVQLPAAEPRDLLPELLEQLKSKALPKPTPVFELLDAEFGWAYVKTPLDFRAGGDSWRTVTVSASVGPVWATVTAVPNRLTFDPGDPAGPGPMSCDGDGPIAAYVAAVPGACSYTYTNASSTSPFDGYHFVTSLTIDWSISWTSSTGAGGPLDGFPTVSSAQLAVAEVKGLVVCTGARPEQGGC